MVKTEKHKSSMGVITLFLLLLAHVAKASEECNRPLGMESGRITRFQLSASSEWDDNHGPRFARLNRKGYPNGGRGGWSIKWPPDVHQWIQVDLKFALKVTGIETQGREDCCNQWVTNYTVSHGQHSGNETYYKENGKVKVFDGNQDRNSIVHNVLSPPIVARYVRINPTAWYVTISMRMELRGCLNVEESCPRELHDNPTCYEVPPQRRSWNASRMACQVRGGTLALLNSKGKNQLVHEKFFLDSRFFWIGMCKKSADINGWQWVDGSALDYKQWGVGEPNNEGNKESCGEYRTNEKGWNDEQCERTRRFICDVKAQETYDLSGERDFRNQQPSNAIQVQGHYDFCSRMALTCDDCRRVLCVTAGTTSTHIAAVVFGRTTGCKQNFSASVKVPSKPGIHKIRIYRTSGSYCQDASDDGPSRDVGSVHVEGPPVIRGVLSSSVDDEIFASVSQEVSLYCDVGRSSSVVNYTWYKDGVLLMNQSSAQIVVSLRSGVDFGDYECEASNRAGGVRKTLRINQELEGATSLLHNLEFYSVTALLSLVVLVLLLVVITMTVRRSRSNSGHQSEQNKGRLVSLSHTVAKKTSSYTEDRTASAEYSEPTTVKSYNFKNAVYEDLRKVPEQKYHSLDPSTIARKESVQVKTTEITKVPANVGPPYEDVERLHTAEGQYLELIA